MFFCFCPQAVQSRWFGWVWSRQNRRRESKGRSSAWSCHATEMSAVHYEQTAKWNEFTWLAEVNRTNGLGEKRVREKKRVRRRWSTEDECLQRFENLIKKKTKTNSKTIRDAGLSYLSMIFLIDWLIDCKSEIWLIWWTAKDPYKCHLLTGQKIQKKSIWLSFKCNW